MLVKLMESQEFNGFSEPRRTFGSLDIVDERHVFDIRGSRYRLVCGISYPAQICYVKAVLTHREYDAGAWK